MTTATFYEHTPAPYTDECRADCAGCAEKARDFANGANVIGARVRSYDFQRHRDCYVEGYVLGLEEREGCPRYVIQVSVDVWQGEALNPLISNTRVGQKVYPPVNGTPRSTGGVCEGVEFLK